MAKSIFKIRENKRSTILLVFPLPKALYPNLYDYNPRALFRDNNTETNGIYKLISNRISNQNFESTTLLNVYPLITSFLGRLNLQTLLKIYEMQGEMDIKIRNGGTLLSEAIYHGLSPRITQRNY